MSILSRFFGSKDDGGDNPPSMPWDQHPSILEFVRSHIVVGKAGLSEEGYNLPDEERISQGSKLRWAAGAMDGVLTHHMGQGDNDETIRKLVGLVVAFSRQPTVENKAAVYHQIISDHIVSVIDPVLEALVNEKAISHQRLYELAYSFTTESPDREPVKFGIAVLGLFQVADNIDLFQTLGRHDEFTLYCAVAITNATENSEEALWELGRNVDGWGRIQVVERLAESATNPSVKDWLLREGYRNSVMYEYLAATCARAGGLLAALSQDRVDRELLTSAGEIIQALMAGGPGEGIDQYEDARPVLQYFVDHMASSASMVADFIHVNSVKEYLGEDDAQWEERYAAGWTVDERERLRSQCESILNRPEWGERVRAMLHSKDEAEFALANQAAKTLGIAIWDIHWRRLQAKPKDAGRWWHVMAQCPTERIEQVIGFAESQLDLAAIATGAADEIGLGPGFEQHSCLDFLLQELGRFPGQGVKLIEAGLKSPVVRNRNMATRALAAWPLEQWPSGMRSSLEAAAEHEPDETARENMQKALRGEALTSGSLAARQV